jgi:molybdopterin-guanine dinucleotide biosynthesis protein A
MPNISAKIIEQLKVQLHPSAHKYNAAVFRDDQAIQCGLFICETAALNSIPAFLNTNQRAVHRWLKTLNLHEIAWQDERFVFKNVNHFSDL